MTAYDATLWDILIVGGGPGGTATAFRAKELGLKALVIDYDDLMKRIRDYSKDKLILPGFGGGDAMKFPAGGDLVQSLYFSAIDKDDMVQTWKGLHQQHGIPSQVGLELTGLQDHPETGFSAICWHHGERRQIEIRCRAVVLAIGCGVPRRFDIPGNTDGIGFRLQDAQDYLGHPACVIGGGTSAAEAVIAISNAKSAAQDKTAVYWSYRGDRLPRVSKALAEVFFEAYAGNGNIRYYPLSEPAAVVTADDHKDYLAIQVDRRRMDTRPAETLHLEFPKEHCIACIGEDIPEQLLNDLGVGVQRAGKRNRKRMVVNRLLEAKRQGVFLVGDLLSQAYFEAEDFDADPATFKEIKHRGNIKTAMRDGVYVAEVIEQKLAGNAQINVKIGDADGPPANETALPQQPKLAKTESAKNAKHRPLNEPGKPAPAYLIRILPGGVAENEYPLNSEHAITIGRRNCALNFENDALLGDTHAAIVPKDDAFYLKDRGAQTGTFLKLKPAKPMVLHDGDLIRVGRQFLLVQSGASPCVVHYDGTGRERGRHQLHEKAQVFGREADISLDPDDKALSRRHLAMDVAQGQVRAKDLKSANGTFYRVQNFVKLQHGFQFQVGRQQLLFSTERDAVIDLDTPEPPAPEVHTASTQAPAQQAEATAAQVTGPSVTFEGVGTFAAQSGQTICDVAESNGVALRAECHAGICGSDPVKIIAGGEHLQGEPDDQECETLEDLCDLEPGPCRLACKAHIKGPVTVQIV